MRTIENLGAILDRIKEKLTNSQTLTFPSSSTTEEGNYDCSRCKDKEYVMVDDKTARVCSCQEQKRIERLFESSQITPAFRTKTLDNYTTDKTPISKDMLKCGKSYLEHYKKGAWLVLLGEPGSGKSHISLAMGNELIKQGDPVLYFQHVEGMKELIDLIAKEKPIKAKIDYMKQVSFLIWDDLFKPAGGKTPTAFQVETAFEILNYRYLNLLPTAINSERTAKELLEIDKAVGSRIIERGKGYRLI